jgi:hypothetical protein
MENDKKRDQGYKRLAIYQKAHDLLQVHEVTLGLSNTRIYRQR